MQEKINNYVRVKNQEFYVFCISQIFCIFIFIIRKKSKPNNNLPASLQVCLQLCFAVCHPQPFFQQLTSKVLGSALMNGGQAQIITSGIRLEALSSRRLFLANLLHHCLSLPGSLLLGLNSFVWWVSQTRKIIDWEEL